MGYDCYVRVNGKPDHDADENYFRRNIWGGSRLAEALEELGMGFNPRAYGLKEPSWPDAKEYGVEWVEWQDDDGDWQDGWKGDRAAEYERDVQAVLSWHQPADVPGIPTHKVCGSNDGWHVTKDECRAALEIYRKHIAGGGEHPKEFLEDFVPFLERAAANDGFEVH